MSDPIGATESLGAEDFDKKAKAEKKRQSTTYSRRVVSATDSVQRINVDLMQTGDVIFIAFSPSCTSNMAGAVFDGPTAGKDIVVKKILKDVNAILAAHRGPGAAAELEKKIAEESKVQGNMEFLRCVLDKAVEDGDLGPNNKDRIIKKVELSGKIR